MSYTFRVIFTGVCAYVPDKPLFLKEVEGENTIWKRQPNTMEGLTVLLPDLRRPGVTPEYPNELRLPRLREPHLPLLKFRLTDLREGTTRRVDLVCRDISEREEEGLLFLRREQIRFSMAAENATSFSFAGWTPYDLPKPPVIQQDGQPTIQTLSPVIAEVPDLGEREQMESLWWLPNLGVIAEDMPRAGEVRSDALPSFRGPLPECLVARVECGGGRLRTLDFNRGFDGKPIKWRFSRLSEPDGEGCWNRAISSVLALEFFDVRGEVKIELRRLANEVVTEELVLAPAPGASRPLVEIEISNREPDLLFRDEGFARTTLPDMDFQAFYDKLSNAEEADWKDLPVPYPGRKSFFGAQEKPCAGGLMAGG